MAVPFLVKVKNSSPPPTVGQLSADRRPTVGRQTRNDFVKPLRAFFLCFIFVLGTATSLSIVFLVLGAGIGLSLNSVGGKIILFSYSSTICLTVLRGAGTGLSITNLIFRYFC